MRSSAGPDHIVAHVGLEYIYEEFFYDAFRTE